ncbi:signal peptidase II [Actinomyces sp. B33]|uniref:signal peptidase II n=1 Tax=Actinomyces sp. B33 TaxID=2942131 RepID=UPI002341F25F|nr:signal peptidase II [Actinomyces sp. B33]MDC4233090.1 signal peptidase II [Actinomyces sp. B33]
MMTRTTARRADRGSAIVGLTLLLISVASDQATKQWALNGLTEGERVPLVSDLLTLQLVHNSGAAFSLGAGSTWVFTVFTVLILAGLVLVWRAHPSMSARAAIGLLAGGAIGNLIDRMVRPPAIGQGHVVDFINYNGWFVGNVADIWIVVAAAWLALVLTSRQDRADGGRERR